MLVLWQPDSCEGDMREVLAHDADAGGKRLGPLSTSTEDSGPKHTRATATVRPPEGPEASVAGATSTPTPGGFIIITALVNKTPARVKLDLAADANLVSARFASKARLRAEPLPLGRHISFADFAGKTSADKICPATSNNVPFESSRAS